MLARYMSDPKYRQAGVANTTLQLNAGPQTQVWQLPCNMSTAAVTAAVTAVTPKPTALNWHYCQQAQCSNGNSSDRHNSAAAAAQAGSVSSSMTAWLPSSGKFVYMHAYVAN
jgi:hypothetical protein